MPAADLAVGTLIDGDRLRITKRLGADDLGVILKAHDAQTGEEVVAKLIHKELLAPPGRERTLAEADRCRGIEHRNVIGVGRHFDVGERLAFQRDFLVGSTVANTIKNQPLGWKEAAGAMCGVLGGLGALHAHDMIHGDISPTTVVITEDGTARIIEVVGHFLRRRRDKARAGGLQRAEFVAPEQIKSRRQDARTDVYLVGLLAYLCMTGKMPFKASHWFEWHAAHMAQEPDLDSLARVAPETVVDVIAQALAKAPEARWESAAAMARALEHASKEAAGWVAPVIAAPVHDVDPSAPSPSAPAEPGLLQRIGAPGIAAIVLVLGLIVGAFYALSTDDGPARHAEHDAAAVHPPRPAKVNKAPAKKSTAVAVASVAEGKAEAAPAKRKAVPAHARKRGAARGRSAAAPIAAGHGTTDSNDPAPDDPTGGPVDPALLAARNASAALAAAQGEPGAAPVLAAPTVPKARVAASEEPPSAPIAPAAKPGSPPEALPTPADPVPELPAPGADPTFQRHRAARIDEDRKPPPVDSKKPPPSSINCNRDAIKAVFRRNRAAVFFCYKRRLRDDPTLYGKITATVIINAQGRMASTKVVKDTLGDDAVSQCMRRQLRIWRFPTLSDGGSCAFQQTWHFRSK